jgi:transmembrane sensor
MSAARNSRSQHGTGKPGASEVEAAAWTLRIQQGLSQQEEQLFATWLAANPRHTELMASSEETLRLLDGLKFRVPAGSLPVVRSQPAVRSDKRLGRRVLAGMAAALVLGAGAWFMRSHPRDTFEQLASTQLGEVRRVELPDGSSAVLNTNTVVEFSFDKDERRVRLLGGEAYFSVAKNPARPFIVQAGRLAVRAVGTAFDVRLHTDSLSVLVTEGKVSVNNVAPASRTTAPQEPVRSVPILAAGHMGRLALDPDRAPSPEGMQVSAMEERGLRNALAWQEGRLEFFDTPLSEVVAEFNRYNRHKLVITDPELAAQRFGGGFASHETEPLLELLEQSFGVVTENRGNETLLRRAR